MNGNPLALVELGGGWRLLRSTTDPGVTLYVVARFGKSGQGVRPLWFVIPPAGWADGLPGCYGPTPSAN